MATPQEIRKKRLKNDYKQMCNIQGTMIQWITLNGEPPYVDSYEVTIKVRSIIDSKPSYRNTHVVRIVLPENYPNSSSSGPQAKMVTKPQPFHPNWYTEGRWCHGYWAVSEGLGEYVIRMIRTLQFDKEITNPSSPANPAAATWYRESLNRKNLFPCDQQVLPDPTKARFEIQNVQRKKFEIA